MLTLKPDLKIRCDGRPLVSEVTWGDLSYSYGWPNGCADASLRITRPSQQRPRIVRRGVLLEVTWGGWPIWAGTLDQPEWNGREAQLKAVGLYKLGEAYKAFNLDGTTTDNPAVAIVAAATQRGLPWIWTTAGGIPNVSLGGGTTDPVNSILDLLEATGEQNGMRWGVNARRQAYMFADPTTPEYHIPAGVVDMPQSSEGYKSRIVLRYQHTNGGFRTMWWPGITMPASTADWTANERLWSYNEWTRDVTEDLGPISDAQAQTLAQKLYELGGSATPGWANGVTVAYGQILNRGGRPVHPAAVEAGKMVRLHGVPDELRGTNHVDFVIGDTSYKHGDKSVGINPVGIVVNTPEDAWTQLFESGE